MLGTAFWLVLDDDRGGIGATSTGPGLPGNPLAKTAFKLAPLGTVVVAEEGDCLATLAHATGATDAVGEQLGRFRKLKVDDVIDCGDIDTSGGNIGCQQHGHLAGAEIGHDGVTGVLREIALQRRNRITSRFHLLGQLAHAMFGPTEDDHLTLTAGIEDVLESVDFATGGNVVSDMVDLLGFRCRCRNSDLGRIAQMPMRSIIYPFRHGGREEGSLPGLRSPAQDLVDLRSKTAVQHFISFIENKETDMLEVQRALAVEIGYASWCADDDLGTAAQLVDLRTKGPTAVDQRNPNIGALDEFTEDGSNLNSEFPGWSEDKNLDTTQSGINDFNSRDAKGESFAGTCPGLSDDITTSQQERKRVRLNFGWLGNVHAAKGVVSCWTHLKLGEG